MNQYDPCISQVQEGSRPLQADEVVREIKKLRRGVEETNRLLCFLCFALMQHTYECGGAFDCNSAAMLLGLEPSKRKKRKKELDVLGLMQRGW